MLADRLGAASKDQRQCDGGRRIVQQGRTARAHVPLLQDGLLMGIQGAGIALAAALAAVIAGVLDLLVVATLQRPPSA